MKKGIVLKLFMLTTALCTLILVTIFIGQTIFFKQYYANRKVNDIKTNIQSFEKAYIKAGDDAKVIQELEQNFYQENATWITTLDSVGNIKYANDFSIEIQLDPNENKIFSERSIHIPLYSFINLEDIQRMKYSLEQGSHIIIDGVQKGDIVVPAMLTIKEKNVGLENKQLSERLYGPKAVSSKESSQLYLAGSIQNVQLPEGTVGTNFIYGNRVLIDRIKQFQVDLLLNQKSNDVTSTEIMDYEENDIKYKVLIKPTKDAGGKTNYIFAMTSLQPVDEAVQMIKDYYVYLIIFVLILIVLISFYYSKKIAKPLLQINDTTKKIAGLDFSETIPITTKDEIGDLSQNINTLSKALHSYIHQLQQDIEKEKQLENTRKEFIAGVSHELKTPLSIMKSCISILEDGVASNKKEYYFKAMSKEVDKMDMLIIDMLELAKFESGTYKMEMDVFHIDEMIDYICEQLTSDITAKQLHVHKQLSKIEVVANQHRIEQVITNFITNAIRYTPEQENIIISTIEENERVKVCVENKGAHIAPEHLEKIWDRFYRKEKQLENTRKEFIAGVSHELKTPLSIMKSCISILEDGVASNKKEYYFKAMSKEVDKMDMLIIDMLELAKFESGTYKMEMDVFHIDEMIDYICEQLTSDITAKQLHVHKQLSKIEVVANQHRIEQVITNFITNAIRYTPEQENIIISTIEENERVKVCVENKGAHIAPEHLEKIWDRFYRGDTSRQRSKGGTGLGLAISKNILELHDAEYGVSNTEDGVLFYFYLNKNV